jgi:hypothetical protein
VGASGAPRVSAGATSNYRLVAVGRDATETDLRLGETVEWVTAPLNDGVEVFALPQRLTRALADAGSAELEELAGRWTTRLRSADGDDMTDDDLLAVLQGVARLAASAVRTGGGLYSWSF